MKFAEPLWLAAGLGVCITMALLLWRSDRERRRILAAWVSSPMVERLTANFSPGRRLLKRILFLTGAVCLFAALARPQAGFKWQEVKRKGTDILVAVDVSRSMLTQDVAPSRLERAKLSIRDLIAALDGDRVGLIPFAGNAYLMCPPTLDYDALSQSIDELSPDLVPVGGTNIGAAVQAALKTLESSSAERKVMILMTDGEDLDGSAKDWAKEAAAKGLVIYTIGIGTTSGELIPVTDANGGTSFVKDENGTPVRSRLDETMLRQIAEITHGEYISLAGNSELDRFYRETVAKMPKKELKSRMQRIPREQYQWPLLAGLLLLASELLIRERRGKKIGAAKSRTLLAALLMLAAGSRVQGAEADQIFHQGVNSYKSQQYDAATKAFNQSLKTENLDLQENAFYNLGNTQYRQGEPLMQRNPEECRKIWEQAVKSYEASLALKPKDADAKFNRDFVLQRLKMLPPPQKQQDQKDQKDQKDNKDQKNDSQKNPDQQNGQDKNSKPDQKNGQDPQNQNQPGQKDPKDPQNNPGGEQKKPGDQAQNPSNGQQSQNNKPPQQPGQQPESGQDKNGQAGGDEEKSNGMMTRREAQNLLQSMKNDEHLLPVVPVGPRQDQDVKRNW